VKGICIETCKNGRSKIVYTLNLHKIAEQCKDELIIEKKSEKIVETKLDDQFTKIDPTTFSQDPVDVDMSEIFVGARNRVYKLMSKEEKSKHVKQND
jgi:hypothetical protein